MSKPFMPFRPEFRDAVISGRKKATSRTKRYGIDGDLLETPFGQICLLSVVRYQLQTVRDYAWNAEGCDSPEDFERVWNEIHPRKKYDPEQLVWLHVFRYLGESR